MFVTIGARGATEDLVGLLLACHQRIRAFSQLAVQLGRREDLPSDEILDAAQRCERYFFEALPLHVEDEEQSLVPRLPSEPDLDRALLTMRGQHTSHAPRISALLVALAALRAEPHDARRREALRQIAEPLALEFEEHLALEESVIFPAAARLPRATQQLIMDELRARRRHPANSPPG